MPADSLYYFDANALWKYYREQQGAQTVHRLVADAHEQVLVSPLTMLECVGVLMKYHRKGFVKRKHVRAIARRMRRDAAAGNSHRPFRVVDLPSGAFREAEGILLELAGQHSFGSSDALHLGVIVRQTLSVPVVFVTADQALQQAAQRRSISWYDPEKDTSG